MNIDWQFIGTSIGFSGVIIALIALLVETRITRITYQTDTLLHLEERFQSTEIKALRKIAAKKLLQDNLRNEELGELLEFFAIICYLIATRAIDEKLAYFNFSWWIIRYYLSADKYIKEVRKLDPMSWVTMESVVKKLIKREMKQGYQKNAYSQENLHDFCKDEASIKISQ